MPAAKLPAFETLLKSREVEDPVNLWLHRPLAYGIVALLYKSPITPNQITVLAMLAGVASGLCFIEGSPALMVWGGALLWASAILDGADGILARAQGTTSALGRALDGASDAVVAISTVLPGFYHLYMQGADATLVVVATLAIATAVLHIELYDYYKESYLQMTRPSWSGEPERLADVEKKLDELRAQGAGFAKIAAWHAYIGLVRAQTRIVAKTNPLGAREHLSFRVNEQTAALYRKHNRGPMQLWAAISLAPHSYTMAICAMLDRLDVYLWLRLFLANAIFVWVLLWQRAASRKTREGLDALGMSPVPYAGRSPVAS